ncbi:MAG: hypothetical protein QOI74_2053, partial [Micromonosporaceae bacterium]|nr:hypothetical protein [Micromonosporaceae bacterium]
MAGVALLLAVTAGTVGAGHRVGSRSARGPGGAGASGARLRPVDGGAGYYGRFSSSLPSVPSFFPVAVWQERVGSGADTHSDVDAGLNTYLAPTEDSDLALIAAAGMYSISSAPRQDGPATAGWFLADEADMWGGPGDDGWTGNYPGQGDICTPASAKCGYSIMRAARMRFPDDGRLRYANYGKGVAFWETAEQGARFVNEFSDVVSADTYWLTDAGVCGASQGGSYFGVRALSTRECRLPANYGRTVDYLRAFVKPAGSKPVWSFVEVGHPGDGDPLTAQPAQVAAAVWSSIIHGARGIVYFNHSFGGRCPSPHVLREPCYAATRAAVKRVDEQVKALAPVLNAPFADGVAAAGAGVDLSTKYHDGHFYLLAAANTGDARTVAFALPCVGDATITVLNENRTVAL